MIREWIRDFHDVVARLITVSRRVDQEAAGDATDRDPCAASDFDDAINTYLRSTLYQEQCTGTLAQFSLSI